MSKVALALVMGVLCEAFVTSGSFGRPTRTAKAVNLALRMTGGGDKAPSPQVNHVLLPPLNNDTWLFSHLLVSWQISCVFLFSCVSFSLVMCFAAPRCAWCYPRSGSVSCCWIWISCECSCSKLCFRFSTISLANSCRLPCPANFGLQAAANAEGSAAYALPRKPYFSPTVFTQHVFFKIQACPVLLLCFINFLGCGLESHAFHYHK
jgi:hypothetical protein